MNLKLIQGITLCTLFIAALLITLTACGTLAKTDGEQDIARACSGITAAEQAFAAAEKAGKVSAANATRAQQWIALTQPVCNVIPEPASIDAAVYAELPLIVATLEAASRGQDIPAPNR